MEQSGYIASDSLEIVTKQRKLELVPTNQSENKKFENMKKVWHSN